MSAPDIIATLKTDPVWRRSYDIVCNILDQHMAWPSQPDDDAVVQFLAGADALNASVLAVTVIVQNIEKAELKSHEGLFPAGVAATAQLVDFPDHHDFGISAKTLRGQNDASRILLARLALKGAVPEMCAALQTIMAEDGLAAVYPQSLLLACIDAAKKRAGAAADLRFTLRDLRTRLLNPEASRAVPAALVRHAAAQKKFKL